MSGPGSGGSSDDSRDADRPEDEDEDEKENEEIPSDTSTDDPADRDPGSGSNSDSDPDSDPDPDSGFESPDSTRDSDRDLDHPHNADSAADGTSGSTRNGRESDSRNGPPDPEQNGGEHAVAGSATAQSESARTSTSEPNPEPGSEAASTEPVTIEDDGIVRWFFKTNDGTVVAIRDVLSSMAVVALIGLVLFGISGVWPPLVAVESGSMQPNMKTGDLIFVVDEERFVGDDPTGDTGIVTHADGQNSGHEKFGEPGDVIIFQPNGNEFNTPVIHRAQFWVDSGDNWVDEQANPDYLNGATSCGQVATCEANHDGFITKGDWNSGYDQLSGGGADTDVVRSEWVTGKGMFRIPWLGHVRLTFDKYLSTGPEPGVVSATEPGVQTTPVLPNSPTGLAATTAALGLSMGVLRFTVRRRYG
ncbi:S26 family signal peptidase [Halobacteria archaeon AArc-m2/3/4]|uniref:S26 family signal peptidase n=1 Tax=Natronoglomus mannanivorans TaxID=2979990 RepID=A0ABT2QBB1_9EURY|nr:S26 family signal peptidase [Halobacteria archaeon AArc-m2/3/4]